MKYDFMFLVCFNMFNPFGHGLIMVSSLRDMEVSCGQKSRKIWRFIWFNEETSDFLFPKEPSKQTENKKRILPMVKPNCPLPFSTCAKLLE